MSRAASEPPDRVGLGILLIVVSVFLMSLGDALVRSLSAALTLWQVFLLRSLLALPLLMLPLLATLIARRRQPSGLGQTALGWIALRSLLLVGMWIAFYVALPLLPLSLAASALYTAPLLVALLSALAIGEPPGPRLKLALGLGFLGVLVILRPGTEAFSWAMTLPLLAAGAYALAMVITRSKCGTTAPLALSFALNLCFLVAGLLGVAALWLLDPLLPAAAANPFLLGDWVPLDRREWGLLVLLALLFVAVATGVARAYQCGPPAVIATFDYAYLPFAVLWGLMLFRELPDAATVTGMALIAVAGCLVLWRPPTAGPVRAPKAEET